MKKPLISIIIPTKNEEKYISKLLDSLIEQDYPKENFEVLIFDGLSEDKTLSIAKTYKKKLNIRIFVNKKIKQVFAWNGGIKKAKGDFIIILGAHSIVKNDFIKKNVETLLKIREKEPKLAGVGGTHSNLYENKFAKISALMLSSPFLGGSSFRYSEKPGFKETIVFGFYDKKILKEINGFDEDFIIGEDYELNLRLNKRGYKLYFNPEIKSSYYSRSSLSKFIRQMFNYGAAKGLCIRAGYNKIVWWAPILFLFYEILFLGTMLTKNTFLIKLSSLPAIIYLLLDSFFSTLVFSKTKDFYAFLLLIMHPIIHNIVAFGFIKGLIRGRSVFK
ncbi:MAG: glycosyltransferase [Candidatus Woesearchaeota archaeon]